MAQNQIQKLNPTHLNIMRWLCEPENLGPGHMRRCALEFGVTQSWLSTIVNSDVFQARWQEIQKDLDSALLPTIQDQLRGTAVMALESLQEKIENGNCGQDMLLEIADRTTKALGMGPKPGVVTSPVQNNIVFSVEELKNARDRAVREYLEPGGGERSDSVQTPAPSAKLEYEGEKALRGEEEGAGL